MLYRRRNLSPTIGLLTLALLLLLAACTTPPRDQSAPAPAVTAPPAAGADELALTLPITQPLASLVLLDAGVVTTTQTLPGADEPVGVVMPVQGAFALPVWRANGDHLHPLALILPDAGRVCEANLADEWPCPIGLQRTPYSELRYLAQALALRGYAPLIVNLNGAYTPGLPAEQQTERALLILDQLLTWMPDEMRQPPFDLYGGELSQSIDYDRIVLVGHGRGAEIALALAEARAGQTSPAPGMAPPAGLLLVAPTLSAGSTLPDLPISLVQPGCAADAGMAGLIDAARAEPERASLLASVTLPGATAGGFLAQAAAEPAPCAGAGPLDPARQQAWLAAYAPDFADAAAGYAPPNPAAGLDVLAPMPEQIHGLPAAASVSDPGRPVQPGVITLFNLGQVVAEQPLPPPADGMPLRVEGTFILPEGEGPHPLVLWLHLRGRSCISSAGQFEAVWPCAAAGIPRYEMGYDYLLHALAERGYAVVAPNLVGAFVEAPAWGPTGDPEAIGAMDYYRVEPMVDRLLAELAAANQGQSLAFGQDLTGRLDMSQLIFGGHSRGGEWANVLALRRAGHDSPEEIAAGRGPARAFFLLAPVYGDFSDLDPATLRVADLPFAVAPAYCDDDLKEDPLMGQIYLEEALADETRSAPAWVAALKTGEHYGFVTSTRWPVHNSSSIFCQDFDTLLDLEGAQAFLTGLAPDFVDVALGRQPAAAIPGFDPAAPLPAALYGAPIEITALDPARRRLIWGPRSAADLETNQLGGAVSADGSAALSFCVGAGEQMCIVDETVELLPNAPPDEFVYAQPKFAGFPPQARVQWDAPDGRLSLEIPAGQGDLSDGAALHFRVLVDMFDPRNAGLDAQALRVALTDAAGNQAAVTLAPDEPALIRDRGERSSLWNWAYYPLRPRSVRIPLDAFQGVDRANLRRLDFIFDQTGQGSLLLSDVEFVTQE